MGRIKLMRYFNVDATANSVGWWRPLLSLRVDSGSESGLGSCAEFGITLRVEGRVRFKVRIKIRVRSRVRVKDGIRVTIESVHLGR